MWGVENMYGKWRQIHACFSPPLDPVCCRRQAPIPLILKQNLMFDAVANVKEMDQRQKFRCCMEFNLSRTALDVIFSDWDIRL